MERKVGTVTVLKKEDMHSVQQENIKASIFLSNLIKSCIGPRSMIKMILTRIGTIELTNDGNSILREIEVTHPVIKSLIELSRTQNEEVGDGTTSVVILSAEILKNMSELLKSGHHPVYLCNALKKILDILLNRIKKYSIDIKSKEGLFKEVVKSGLNTKMSRYIIDLEDIALRAVAMVRGKTIDIKNIRVEKVPGGKIEETTVFDGIIVQKSLLDYSMRKKIENAKILLIDFPLEYRKGENQMSIEMHTGEAFTRALEVEEEQIEKMVGLLAKCSPDMVVSEKGISDYAISLFKKHGISAIRRIKKSENQRIALATGAQIVSRAEDATAQALGVAGLFEVSRIGDEEYCKFIKCKDPKACTILLRGQSRDILNELERNLQDALAITRNAYNSSAVVLGAGCIEMALAHELESVQGLSDKEKSVFTAVIEALQSIPAALISNSGNTKPLVKLLELKAWHSKKKNNYGVDGNTGEIVVSEVYESILVKEQSLKSAIEGAIIILRVDGIVKQE
ncbi:T-complex protein 1 subunit gamma [Nematocida minor]|uniref:T-complex protein 1 subunit gamma n=1 Tax=Nematocida minor TaxID=1912983 RepID=UPI00221EC62A|nr:T-complex protein 1 subunit gamma [Nematocida minor]KAI5190981.1 T-complex protein 1 subunit gamma [Nematocida minor]